ncbi:MAG: tetratricopeptide repeat protein [Candidatus Aminicenantes bacterium]|nr:tetratricopeptide repeat protein [Candidatus Aminicenantes bacterium]
MKRLRIKNSALLNKKIVMLILLIACCLFISGCAAKQDIDLISKEKSDLEKLLNTTPDNPLKVEILNELAYRESWNGGPKPREYAENARKLAKKIGFPKGLVEARCISGLICFLTGDLDQANRWSIEGLKLAKKIKYDTGKAMAYNGLARYLHVRGAYAAALENLLRSEEICRDSAANKDKRELAHTYYRLGALYYYEPMDYKESLKYFERHLRLGEEINDQYIITSGYYAIGVQDMGMGKYEEANFFFRRCLINSRKFRLVYNMANAYEGLGDVAVDSVKYDDALKYYRKSHKWFKQTGNKFLIAENKKRIGALYNKMGNYRKARDYLMDAFKIANKIKVPKTLEGVCEEIVKSYEKLGDYQSASKYYKFFLERKEFLSKNEMLRIKLIHDSEKKAETERATRISLIIGFIGLFIVLMVVIWNLLKIHKQKKELEISHQNVERMSEIGQAITSSLSVSEIIERVYENVNQLMDAAGFHIGIYNEEKQRLELPGGKEHGKEVPYHYNDLSEINRLSVHCFNNEVGIRIGNFPEEYHSYISKKIDPKVGDSFTSHIFLPLVLIDKQEKKKKIGVIIVQSKRVNAYSDYQYNILKNLAIYVAIALDNANAYKQIEKQKEKIEEQTLILAEQKEKVEAALIKEKSISHHKDLLMHTVSHQYKTPISIIGSSAQILKDYLPTLPEEEIQGHYDKIFFNLERMTNLIDNLLMFGETFTPGYYNLFAICKDIIEEIKSGEGKDHIIEFTTSGDCDKVRLDKDFMNIMLHNLVSNSIKFSSEENKIHVEISCSESWAVIKVSDNGIGIPGDYLRMPFERFHRGINVGAVPGTGLGLSIVKRYTYLHGGDISIESMLNAGTTVTLRIPKNSFENGGENNE